MRSQAGLYLSVAGLFLSVAGLFLSVVVPGCLYGQALSVPWSGYGHDPQHTANSATSAQPLNNIHWSTPVDVNNVGTSGPIYVHYGSPLITAANTVIVPQTQSSGAYEMLAYNGSTGALIYTLTSDYTQPPHGWTPSYGAALALGTRIYYPGAGGTVYYRTSPDSGTGTTGQIAFYGSANYTNNKAAFNSAIQICTPLTADRSGNIYFGFVVDAGSNPGNLNLVSGIARISITGAGTWVSATAAAGGDASITQPTLNCAPALSNTQTTLYIAVSNGSTFGTGYLVSLNAANLAPLAHVELYDPRGGLATVSTDSSAAPTVGPDGDVYYGVLENSCCYSHNDRGWLLHFNSTLSQTKIPGSFGWDTTAAIVPASLVSSYTGHSSYLVLTKYNNYAGIGTGNGINQVAVLDPNASMQDEYSSTAVQVMQEVITVTGMTPDPHAGYPNAVREWCINSAVIDAGTKSAIVNSEDGVVYHWDFGTNTLSQSMRLTAGAGEAYTPTMIGSDGTVFAINDATIYAVGR